jgi:DNA-binding protein YbaB
MFNKLKQINDIRKQAKEMQNALSEIMVVGQSSGQRVMVTIDGNQSVQSVKIEPTDDVAKIESDVKDALNDAMKKLQKELATKMQGMGGLDALKDMLGGAQ